MDELETTTPSPFQKMTSNKGDTLFHALSLGLNNTTMYHFTLRQEIANFIENNLGKFLLTLTRANFEKYLPQRYLATLPNDYEISTEDYINYTRTAGAPGDEFHIQAFNMLYEERVNAVVWKPVTQPLTTTEANNPHLLAFDTPTRANTWTTINTIHNPHATAHTLHLRHAPDEGPCPSVHLPPTEPITLTHYDIIKQIPKNSLLSYRDIQGRILKSGIPSHLPILPANASSAEIGNPQPTTPNGVGGACGGESRGEERGEEGREREEPLSGGSDHPGPSEGSNPPPLMHTRQPQPAHRTHHQIRSQPLAPTAQTPNNTLITTPTPASATASFRQDRQQHRTHPMPNLTPPDNDREELVVRFLVI